MGLLYNNINHTKIENAFIFNALYGAILTILSQLTSLKILGMVFKCH